MQKTVFRQMMMIAIVGLFCAATTAWAGGGRHDRDHGRHGGHYRNAPPVAGYGGHHHDGKWGRGHGHGGKKWGRHDRRGRGYHPPRHPHHRCNVRHRGPCGTACYAHRAWLPGFFFGISVGGK